MEGDGGSKGEATAAGTGSVVPESAIEAVNETLSYLKELKPQLEEMFSLAEPEVLAQMQPLQRAKTMYLLAQATTTIFALKLRCTGVDPDDHRVKSEIVCKCKINKALFDCFIEGGIVCQERLNVYREKFQRCTDRSKEPLRLTTVLNSQAATRFIEHSLPDLTSAQKQSIRDLSKREKSRIRNSGQTAKKRKYQSNEKHSVQSAAKEFLEKAAREILGNNASGIKGPLMAAADGSDDAEVGTA